MNYILAAWWSMLSGVNTMTLIKNIQMKADFQNLPPHEYVWSVFVIALLVWCVVITAFYANKAFAK